MFTLCTLCGRYTDMSSGPFLVPEGNFVSSKTKPSSVAGLFGPSRSIESPTASVSKDDVFEVLSNRRRRHVLHYLQRREGEVDLGTLAERVAAWENERPVERITSDDRKRVYTALQQFHLPKMDEKGLIEYDRRSGSVELAKDSTDVDVYLGVITENEPPWGRYYLCLSVVGLVVVGLSTLGVPPLTVVSSAGWAMIVACSIAVSAAFHENRNCRSRIGTKGTPPEAD